MTIRDELDAINAGVARALAEQDATRFASYYTDDARMLSHGQPIIRGRAGIEAEVSGWVTKGPVTVSFETSDVIADGSLIVDIGGSSARRGRAGMSSSISARQMGASGWPSTRSTAVNRCRYRAEGGRRLSRTPLGHRADAVPRGLDSGS